MSLKAEAVSYRYESIKTPALDAASLEIKKGELVAVCGSNGSGKSTLLRCLAGLAKPSSGYVTIDGHAAERSRRKIGFAVQFPERALFERTAFDDVAFGPRNMGKPVDEVKRRVETAVDAVGLSRDLLGASPHSLSYGQKRLLAIACAIVHGPEYLFLDEPAAGLDSQGRRKITGLISELNSAGMTVVVASHDPTALLDNCSRLIALKDGRIIVDGPPTYANARLAGIRSETMELAEQLKSRGMNIQETFSPEALADMIAEALK
ncbi:MAG TPA: ABC transporter ATP-binding protein [Methanocella sp.]